MLKISPQIIRSSRRTLALVVTAEATLVVRAPMNISVRYIQDFVARKQKWIRQKLAQAENRPKILPKQFIEGEEFLFLGKRYRLQLTEAAEISLKDTLLFPQTFLPKAREKLIAWYRAQSREIILSQVNLRAKDMGLSYASIRITSAGSRWGSCSSRGRLNFSYRLLMAPREVLDYVVVHELAHLCHKNHSAKFWNSVRLFVPEFKSHHLWLKHNHQLLDI